MISGNMKSKKKGFTLVELLAVIVILAIILVIAVPKVMSIIEDAKMGTLESTAKMIASAAEKQKVQNTVLGNDKEITCDSVAKINKGDYASCDITFENNTAKVTIEGSAKFDGLWVCNGTKTNAEAQKESCVEPLQVKHPLFLKGQELTPDMFEVTFTDSDGNTKELWSGGLKADETAEATTISSPNWPNNYDNNMTEEENYWEATYEGAEAIQITFDATSETEALAYDYIVLYDKEGNQKYKLGGSNFAGKTYVITGNYVKVTMRTASWTSGKGFSATIKPMVSVPAEYTISPSVVPNTEGNFDITILATKNNISKQISGKVGKHASDYISSLETCESFLKNGLINPKVTYNEVEYNTGIRYVGEIDEVKNKVYYNCDDKDNNNIAYGEDNYNYAGSCEVWRIIGLFDVKNENENIENRVKLINYDSTFSASWDSSYGGLNWDPREVYGINGGYGINQWGESRHDDGTPYEGADLMQLLNGYYIGKDGSACIYCNGSGQSECAQTCTSESLKSINMKPLTTNAKRMIENAVWDTYATNTDDAENAYLQEKGISAQYTGKMFICDDYCNDTVVRTTSWIGLVGLISVNDITYANGWLYRSQYRLYPRTISGSTEAYMVWGDNTDSNLSSAYIPTSVLPSVYLKSNIKIVSGNGDTEPYVLAM